ncbi:MAG TPA: GtrA family protein [Caulobacteraceae bacterium]|nr:GtrA family protein [Caulobacteraceae bacterium]
MKLPVVVREVNLFIAVGLAATACNYVAALAAQRFGHIGPMAAQMAGYLASVSISYFGNSLLTFRRPPLHGPQIVRFMTISLFGLVVGLGAVFVGSHLMGLPFWQAEIPVVVLVPAATFVMSKFWAFREPAPAQAL